MPRKDDFLPIKDLRTSTLTPQLTNVTIQYLVCAELHPHRVEPRRIASAVRARGARDRRTPCRSQDPGLSITAGDEGRACCGEEAVLRRGGAGMVP